MRMDRKTFLGNLAIFKPEHEARHRPTRPHLRFMARDFGSDGNKDVRLVGIDASRYPGAVLRQIRARSVNEQGEERRECRRRRLALERARS